MEWTCEDDVGMVRLKKVPMKVAVFALFSALGLSACSHLLPPGGWDRPLKYSPKAKQETQPPLSSDTPPVDSLAVKARQQMFQMLRKLTDEPLMEFQDRENLQPWPGKTLSQRDPWGTHYRLSPDHRLASTNLPRHVVLTLISAGPDCQFETEDDIRIESREFPPPSS